MRKSKDTRKTKSILNRIINNSIGKSWDSLHEELKDVSQKHNFPSWELNSFLKEKIVQKSAFENGEMLDTKGKPYPNGTLYLSMCSQTNNLVLTKYTKPKQEEEYDIYEDYEEVIEHPDPPGFRETKNDKSLETKKDYFDSFRLIQYFRGNLNTKFGKKPFKVGSYRPNRTKQDKYYLVKDNGIWHEGIEMPPYSWNGPIKITKQLNKQELKKYGLENSK